MEGYAAHPSNKQQASSVLRRGAVTAQDRNSFGAYLTFSERF